MTKEQLAATITSALDEARASGDLPLESIPAVTLEMPKNRAHGDWACNVAMILGKMLGRNPREVAEKIVARIPVGEGGIAAAEIAGPGFINFTLRPDWLYAIVRNVLAEGEAYGQSKSADGQRVLVEFVSTNPNGPITVAGGRNAAIGDVLASLLKSTGYEVSREYYINDALNSAQMNNFGRSVFYRYQQLLGHKELKLENGEDPEWLYRGDYVEDVAKGIVAQDGKIYENADIEDPQTVQTFRQLAEGGMIAQQKADLEAFGVTFDRWFSEATLHDDGQVTAAIEELTKRGHTYEKDGALWLRTTAFGDDKDRVLLRADGTPTYIAGDAAYHKNKFDRGFDRIINVWGADHHSYIARTKAAIAGLGYDADRVDVLLYQLVRIMKDGEFVKSSKRRGDVLELKADLIDEIGKDAARFFFLMRSPNTDLDIDIDLAKKTEKDNPVYYVQYAHARIAQTIEKALEVDSQVNLNLSDADLSLLKEESEIDLIKKLSDLTEEIQLACQDYAPHRITQYARDLAALFHGFYDAGNRNPSLRVVCDDPAAMKARIALVSAVGIVLRNVLTLLGLSAPTRM